MPGLIHIYCGDGKGKTTAAIGLAVRAAGAGKQVLLTQFFKDGSSSECRLLGGMENIRILHCKTVKGLWKRMDEEQKLKAAADYSAFLELCLEEGKSKELLVLDEVISACNHGAVPEARLAEFLEKKPPRLEVVLTGRKPSDRLLNLADYVTRMEKRKHPFDRGIPARKGIEF